MAVGLPLKTTYAKGDVYSASDVNDTNGTINLLQTSTFGFAAGKNRIINGDFGIWQRGTSFSNPSNGTYTADRWFVELDGTGFTRTISQQTFTPGTAPVSGYEGTFFFRWNTSVAGTGNTIQALSTRLEDIRTFAGQTVTLSFWAKADASRALTVYAYQQSTGGSGTVTTTVGTATLTTSWARYTMSIAIPSLTGITIGTNSNLQLRIAMPTGVTMTCDFWGMQLESGSTATAFQTATGTKQGELAACQRYYYRLTNGVANAALMSAFYFSSSSINAYVPFPVTMRTSPTIDQVTGTNYYSFVRNGGTDTFNSFTLDQANATGVAIYNNSEASGTAGQAGYIFANNASAYLAFTSEL